MKKCGWLRLCTTVAAGMTITNFWKLFRYGVKREHYDKFIGIRELLEQIAVDSRSNNFKTYIGNPTKKIPPLDEIDNKGTVYTCRRFNYSSSSPHNSYIRTISDITITTAPTTAIGYTDLNEVYLEGGRYNREARGYYHRILPNG